MGYRIRIRVASYPTKRGYEIVMRMMIYVYTNVYLYREGMGWMGCEYRRTDNKWRYKWGHNMRKQRADRNGDSEAQNWSTRVS